MYGRQPRRFGYGRGRRNRSRKRNEQEEEEPGSSRVHHPRNLRGKEIGLFYARRNKEHKLENKSYKTRPIGTIIFSEAKKQKIEGILKVGDIDYLLYLCERDKDSYSHIQDSQFKRHFLSIIKGNIMDKLNSFQPQITQLSSKDEAYLAEFKNKEKDFRYVAMVARRQKLPSYKEKDNLLKLIEENQVVVVSGETGCGKTTQVSQFILDHYIVNGKGSMCKVVCTQPRRISAITVAERVADERAEPLGTSVGYQIRLERKMPRHSGSITFCTTGVILKQMESDPCLSNVSHLILDEIHERDVTSDFLITILREIIKIRKDLKVILMSATLNSEAFSKYYNDCPHINIPGFTYPVEVFFLEDVLQRTKFVIPDTRLPGKGATRRQWMKQKRENQNKSQEFTEYIEPHARQLLKEGTYDAAVCEQIKHPQSEELNTDLILELLIYICCKEKQEGAILVFLPGMMDISKLYKAVTQSEKFPSSKYVVFPLHSQMPTVNQKQIFVPPPTGMRKIIIATNIAETSITIDDVVFVIDCGKIKISNFDAETNTQTLQPEWVSLANADQRKGRAGRVKPGVCYRLYSKARHMILKQFQEPEIRRVRLDDVILTAKLLQLGDAETFFQNLMDPPDPKGVHLAIELLQRLNALDNQENLTPLGYHLAKLPITPQMGKMILFGAIFSCLDPILSVAASLDFKDAFQIPLGKEKMADLKRVELADGVPSDHLVLHKALSMYESQGDSRNFCWEYFLSSYTLKLLKDMKRDFMGYLLQDNFVTDRNPKNPVHNRNSDNLPLVKAVICAGLYPNVAVAKFSKRGAFVGIKSPEGPRFKIHPKSVLKSFRWANSPIVVFWQKINQFIHDGSMLHPLPIIFFGDHYEYSAENSGVISIGKNLAFRANAHTGRLIEDLRDRMNWFLEHKVTHPGVVDWDETSNETTVLRAIMELITNEEIGLEQGSEDDPESDDESDM